MAKNVQLTIDIKGDQSVGKAAASTKSLRQELKALQTDLQSGKLTGAAFDEGIKKAALMKDQINDVNNRVKALATDGADVALKGFADMATGIVGGFTAAQGAMALFGGENEDVQKTLVKLQGATALLNGIQQVNNTLQGDSAAMVSLNSARLKILTFVQTRYTMAVGGATGAMKIMRIVGMAIPILALVTGITLLIANFDKVKNVVMKFLGPLGNVAVYMGKLIQKFTDFIGVTSQLDRDEKKTFETRDALSKKLQREIDLMEAQGVSAEELYKAKKKLMRHDLASLEISASKAKATQEEKQAYIDLWNAIKVLNASEEKRKTDVIKKEQETTNEAAKKAEEKRKSDIKKRQDDVANEALDRLKAFEDELKFKQEVEDTYNEAKFQKEIEARNKLNEENERLEEERLEKVKADAIFELETKQNLEDAKLGIAFQSAQFLQAIAGKQKGIALAALAIEKGAAIADVIIQGQRANAKITALYPPPANVPFLLANNIRTGLSVATIAATGLSGAKSISSGGGGGGSVQPPNIRGTQTERNGNQPIQPPTKVFVTETDIRTTTRRVDGIYSQATIR